MERVMDLIEFIAARLVEDEMHAGKDIWCADRASAGWEAHFGYNLPYSNLVADGQIIARFTGTHGLPLADGEDDQHQADLMLAARMGSAAKPRAERMLREIAAKRAILGRHQPLRGADGSPFCAWCSSDTDTAGLNFPWPCPDVRDLIAIWSDHPDYPQVN